MIATRGLVVSRESARIREPFLCLCHPLRLDLLAGTTGAGRPPSHHQLRRAHLGRVEIDPTIKNFHWGDMTRALFEAFDAGALHAVLVDNAGNVTEGPGYNLFVVKDGALVTPSRNVLFGISRRTVIDSLRQAGIEVSEQL